MFIVKSNGIEQKFDSKANALCALATLTTFGYKAEMYQKVQINYIYL